MSKLLRYVACALFSAVVLCVPAVSHAQAAFNGTWRVDMATAKFSPKPVTFYIGHGWYHCVSCDTPFTVQADGKDHPVTGQRFDSISVTIVNPQTISMNESKDGRVITEQTRTVSANGKILTVKTTGHPQNGSKPVTFEITAKREGIAPSDVHATSGNWIIEKGSGSENALLTTYKVTGDQIAMTDPTGDSYTAKLDGQDYPTTGIYGQDAVALKLVNPHTIQETDKLKGKVIGTETMTVSPNGKSMTIVATDPKDGSTSTYVAHKQ